MALSRERLKQLLKLNPEAKLYRASNILYVDTGIEKIQINVRAAQLDSITAGFNVPNFHSMKSTEQGKLKKFTSRGDINLAAIGRTIKENKSGVQHPRLSTKGKKTKRMLTYPEVTGTKVNTIVNDFFAAFYNPKSDISGKSLKDAFDIYAKRKKVPARDKDLTANDSIFNAVKKTYDGLSLHERTKKIAKTGSKKILKANVKTTQKSPSFAMTQKVIDTSDKYLMFTNHSITDKEAIKIGSTMKQYFNVDKPISLVTPKGVISLVMPDKKNMTVNGFKHNQNVFDDFQGLHAYNDVKSSRHTSSVASSEAYYLKRQKQIEPEALEVVTKYAKRSIGDYSPGQARQMLDKTTVGDIKKLMTGMGQTSRELKAYNLHDDTPLSKILPTPKYNAILQPAYNNMGKRDTKFDANVAKQYKDTVALGRRIGVSKEDIDRDLTSVIPSGFDGTDKKQLQKYKLKQSKMITSMNNTFTQSLKLDPQGTRTAQSIRALPKVHYGPPDPKKVINALKGGEKGMAWLKSNRLLDNTLANPYLNLEGNMQSQYARGLLDAVLKDVMSGDPRKYNNEAVTALGSMFNKKDLSGVKTHFRKAGIAYMKAQPTREGRLDAKLMFEDLMYDMGDKFGGPNDIIETLKNIKGGSNRREKDLKIAGEQLYGKQTAQTEDYNQKKFSSRHEEMRVVEAEQRKAIAANLKLPKSERRDLAFDTDFTTMSAADKLAYVTGEGFQLEGKNLSELKGKVDKYGKRISKGQLSSDNFKDLAQMADDHGYTGSKASAKDMVKHLDNAYQVAFAETYPGMANENGKVNVNLGRGLFNDLTKQNKKSAKRLGIEKYGQLAKFMNGNTADWAPLIDAFHDKKVGSTSLIFDDALKSENLKKSILQDLGSSPYTDKKKVGQLQAIYDSNKIYTNRDRDAHDLLNNNSLTHPVTGKRVISAKINANQVLDGLLSPYNLKPFEAKKGEAHFGKKTFIYPNKQMDDWFDPVTRKIHGEAELTKAQKNQALIYLDTAGKMKEFQTRGGIDAPNSREVMNTIHKTLRGSDQFVDRQASLMMGTDKNSNQIKDRLRTSMQDKIFQYGELIQNSMEKKDYQTARSYLHGLESLDTNFRGDISKSSIEFAEELFSDPKKALNKRVTSKARSYLGEQAMKAADSHGAELIIGGEAISEYDIHNEKIEADRLKKKLLQYDKVGYTARSNKTNAEFAANFNENFDPYIRAEKEAIAELNAVQKESNERTRQRKNKEQVARTARGDRGPIAPPKKPSFKSKYRMPNLRSYGKSSPIKAKSLGLFKGNIIKPYDGLGPKPLKVWDNIPRDHKVWGEIMQSDIAIPKRIRNWASEDIRKIGKLARQHNMFPKFFNKGGKIPGKGTKDEVPAMLTKGEVVVDRKTSERLGIHTQNDYDRFKGAVAKGDVAPFNDGGVVEGVFGDMKRYKEYQKSLNFNITDNSKPTHNYNFLDPKNYQPTPFQGQARSETVHQFEESNRIAKQVTIDLAADKAFINMGRTDTAVMSDFKVAEDLKMDQGTINKAKENFAAQKLASLGFSKADTREFTEMSRTIKPLKPEEASTNLTQKIANMDPQALEDGLNALQDLGVNVKPHKSAIGKVANINKGASKNFHQSLLELSHDADLLGQTLGKDSSLFKGLDKLSKADVVKTLQKGLEGFTAENIKLDTNAKSIGNLRNVQNALTSLDRVIGDRDFKTGLRDERGNIQGIREQVRSAKSLREHAQSRIGEFGALTMQNAAFGMSYALIGGVQQAIGSTIGFVAQFDDAMKNLQAITSDSTDGLMVMGDAVKQVSTETKFSALEIAGAATILGQAGFSAVDISKSLDGVVQLATATGSGLEEATQILTSTLTIWDKSLADSKTLANEFTAAINESKLDVESLTGAIQYTGNIAASAGISSTDVVTMTGLLKDAGIKRASTLGTGQRLLYGDFAAPSKKFIKSLEDVGISLENFTKAFDDKGIYGALEIMRDAGYGLAQASRGMEVREKAIYVAAINQLDKFQGFREDITGTNAAFVANKVQMEGIGNRFKNMINSWQINLNDSLEDSKGPIGSILDQLTIDIDKRKPSENIGVSGYTLEDRFKPKNDVNIGVGAVAGAAALGLSTSFANKYLSSRLDKVLDTKVAGFSVAPQGMVDKSLVGLSKQIAKLNLTMVKGGATVGLGAGLGAIAAPEGSKIAGATSGGAMTAAWLAGSYAIDKMGELSKDGGAMAKGPRGLMNKFVAASSILAIDNAVIAPLREDPKSFGEKMLGTVGTAIEGAIAGFAVGGPKGALAGAAVGGVAGYNSEVEAAPIGLDQAFSSLTNDAKGLMSEVQTAIKGAETLSDLSNLALRPDKKVDDEGNVTYDPIDVLSKHRLSIEALQTIGGNLKGIEKALGADFGLGKELASVDETEVGNRQLSYTKFSSKGTEVIGTPTPYEGITADAGAESLRSLSKAAHEAMSAKGGVYDRMFKQLNTAVGGERGLEDFKDKIDDADSLEDKLAELDIGVLKPIRDFIKKVPTAAIKFRPQIEALLDNAQDVVSDSLRFMERGRFSGKRQAQRASIDSVYNTLGTRVTNTTDATALGVQEVEALAKSRNISKQAAFDEYRGTSSYDTTRRTFINSGKKETGVNKLLDKLTLGKNQIRDIDEAGIKLVRKLQIGAAKTISSMVVDLGQTMTASALDVGVQLAQAKENMAKDIRGTISKFGDLKGVSEITYAQDNLGKTISPVQNINDTVTGRIPYDKTKLALNLEGLVEISKVNIDALNKNSGEIFKQYIATKANAANFAKTVTSLNSLEEAISTGDHGIVRAWEGLNNQLSKAGIKDVNTFRNMAAADIPSYEEMKSLGVDFLREGFSKDKLTGLDNKFDIARDNLKIKTIQAGEVLAKNVEFAKSETIIQGQQQLAKLGRNYGYNYDQAVVQTDRKVRDANIQSGYRRTDILTNWERSIEAMTVAFENNHDKINRQGEYRQEAINTQEIRGEARIARNKDRALFDLETSFVRGLEDIVTDTYRKKRDLETSFKRGMEDIALNTERAFENLAIKQSRGLEDIAINTARSFQDLAIKGERAYEDLALSYDRGIEDIAIAGVRGIQDIAIKKERGEEKIALSLSRGLEDIAISGARGMEDILTKQVRAYEAIDLKAVRSTEDLYKSLARAEEDLATKIEDAEEDISLTRTRAIEDALTNYADTIAKISRSYSDSIASIERSRQDTIDMFERNLTRPTNVTLDTAALTTVADNLGDVGLALDAHKAALTANTTAVMQNNALQQTQEDIVKAAYSDAYKKTGGEVYDETGAVSADFTKYYDDYMAQNSEGLVDAVLSNALSAAFAGVGFDITSALTDASYIAGAVAAPTPGVTMASAVAGSGLTTDELIAALYDVKSSEVRVTTEAGVILEAQGGMEGALFDLETAMIGIDIKLREAGISFDIAVREAAISLENNLRDIELAYQRNLEDLATTLDRNLDSISLALARGLEDIALSTARAQEDVVTTVAYAMTDLETRLLRAGEDLALSVARAGDDLQTSIRQSLQDLELSLFRAGEDLSLKVARGAEDIATSMRRGAEDIALAEARAIENLYLAIARGAEDILKAEKEAIEDLMKSVERGEEDIDTGMNDAFENLVIGIDRAGDDILLKSQRAGEDFKLRIQEARDDLITSLKQAHTEAGISFKEQLTAAAVQFNNQLADNDLALSRTIEAIKLAFSDTLVDLKTNYDNQKAELDIAITEGLDKISRGYTNSIDQLMLQYDQGLLNLKTQQDQAIMNMYASAVDWSTHMMTSFEAGLTATEWNAAGMISSLQTQINTALSGLKVGADQILASVTAEFKAAFTSDKVAVLAKTVSEPLAATIRLAFSDITKPVKDTIEQVGVDFGNVFDKSIAEPLKLTVTSLTASATQFKQTTVAFDATVKTAEPVYKAFQEGISTYGAGITNLAGISSDIIPMSETFKVGSLELVNSFALLDISADAIDKSGSMMQGASVSLSTASRELMAATTSTLGAVTGLGQVAALTTNLGGAIAAATQRTLYLLNQAIAQAQAAANTASSGYSPSSSDDVSAGYYSSGGFIKGYGGGDIVPAMLEPGEVVIRKEVVREIGVDKFMDLNNSIGGLEAPVQTQVLGLPAGGGQGINVQMNVQAGTSLDILENNMERIADGVRKVFEEYS